jgi:hypothetical protein
MWKLYGRGSQPLTKSGFEAHQPLSIDSIARLKSISLRLVALWALLGIIACGTTAATTTTTTIPPTTTTVVVTTAATTTTDTSTTTTVTIATTTTLSPEEELQNLWGLTAGRHRGNDGQQFEFECPAGGEPDRVWGEDIYTDDSSVCTAAVHAGVITIEEGGTVTIEIRPGLESYEGTTRNGITTIPYGTWGGSFVVVG